jgi:hypothetical protein
MADINVNAGKVPAWYYAAGAAGVFIAYTFYKRLSGPKAAPMAPATSATSTPVVPAGSYGSDYTGAIENLQTSINKLQTAQTTSPSTTTSAGAITATAANQVLAGAGYRPDDKQPLKQYTPISSNSKLYLLVTGNGFGDLLEAVTVGGGGLYYEPNPGQFSLIPGGSVNNLAAGTPLYRQVA